MTSTTGRRNKRLLSNTDLRRNEGFTLLELILVLLIMGIVMAVAAPSLRGFLAGRKSVNAAAQVAALGQYARTQAISTGDVYRLNVDTLDNAYWLTSQKGSADFENIASEFGRRFTLPEGTRASWQPNGTGGTGGTTGMANMRGTGGPGLSTGTAGKGSTGNNGVGNVQNYADFYPDGRTDASTLLLTDNTGRVFEIGCLSETELFQVIQRDRK